MSAYRIYSTYNELVDVEFYQVLKGWFDVNTIALVVAAFEPYTVPQAAGKHLRKKQVQTVDLSVLMHI